jgi:tRNA (guanine-N7-)-methyltransferase
VTGGDQPAPVGRRSVYADRLLEYREFAFSDDRTFSLRGRWREFFAPRIGASFDDRIVFEIGCNEATLLATVAARHPATAFVGIDWKYRALHTAAELVAAGGLKNVALLHGRAQEVRRIFADGEVDEVWVFHPEPCDKPKELPNRLIAEPFLRDVHAVTREGSRLILKTDHGGYYQWTLDLLARPEVSSRFELARLSPNFWHDDAVRTGTADRLFSEEATAYERRFVRKRKPIHYLELLRKRLSPPSSDRR